MAPKNFPEQVNFYAEAGTNARIRAVVGPNGLSNAMRRVTDVLVDEWPPEAQQVVLGNATPAAVVAGLTQLQQWVKDLEANYQPEVAGQIKGTKHRTKGTKRRTAAKKKVSKGTKRRT